MFNYRPSLSAQQSLRRERISRADAITGVAQPAAPWPSARCPLPAKPQIQPLHLSCKSAAANFSNLAARSNEIPYRTAHRSPSKQITGTPATKPPTSSSPVIGKWIQCHILIPIYRDKSGAIPDNHKRSDSLGG
ncbi:MAG: hypothetical protein NTV52_22550 [Acidobacteria bacterium]|nr:hypothetical protein [Acidobacteriota bacterium]